MPIEPVAGELEPDDFDHLMQAIAWGNDDAVVAWFRGRNESSRGGVFERLTDDKRSDVLGGRPVYEYRLWQASIAASAPRHIFVQRLRDFDAATVAVLIDRRPAWLSDAVNEILRRALKTPGWRYPASAFPGIRVLQDAGVIGELDAAGFTISLLFGGGREIVADDQELLDEHIWRVFEVVGPKGLRLLGRSAPDDWQDTFAGLAAEGKLDPARLSAACLDALRLDRVDAEASWFVKLYRRLDLEHPPHARHEHEADLLALGELCKSAARSFALEELAAAASAATLIDTRRAFALAQRVLAAGDSTKADLNRVRLLLDHLQHDDTDATASAVDTVLQSRRPPAAVPRKRPLREPEPHEDQLGVLIKGDRRLSGWPAWNLAYALWLVLVRHDDRRADRYFAKALELHGDDPEILLQAGRYTEFVTGDRVTAGQYYRQALANHVPGSDLKRFEPMNFQVFTRDGLRPLDPRPQPDNLSMPAAGSVYDYFPVCALLQRQSFNPVDAAESLTALRVRQLDNANEIDIDHINDLLELTRFSTVLGPGASSPQRVEPSAFLMAAKRVHAEGLPIDDLANHHAWNPWQPA